MKTVKNDREVNVNAFAKSVVHMIRRYYTCIVNILYQRLPTDWLDESIYHFSDQLGTDFCVADNLRVAIHACFPVATLLDHCRNGIRSAQVGFILQCADRNFLYYV